MIKGEDGQPKCKQLTKLMIVICTLSHGNADPERGFSINKFLFNIHGQSTGEKTIVGVRFVKDFINRNGGEQNVSITKSLLKGMFLSKQKMEGRSKD